MIIIIMSVYKNDKLINFKKAVNSILIQKFNNMKIFIAIDGSVSYEVEIYLQELEKNQDYIKVFYYKNNKGLAYRLNQLIDEALTYKCDYIARMDADDLCEINRFSRQRDYLINNLNIDVVGSDVIEIDSNDKFLFYKKMNTEHEVLVKNIIKKCPLNHPSVMFRRRVFDSGIRYNSELINTQDYYLWVDIIRSGYRLANISEPLLKFRIDENFHSRRGFKKAINDVKSRIYAFRNINDLINISNVSHVFLLFLLRTAPSFIKKIAYRKFRG